MPFNLYAKRSIPIRSCGPTIIDAIKKAGEALQIPVQPIYLPFGDLTDYHPFILDHIEATMIGINSPYLHSKNDSIDHVDFDSLEKCVNLIYETIKLLSTP